MGLVDFVAAEAKVGGGGGLVVVAVNIKPTVAAPMLNLPPLLRGVVFLGRPHLGAGVAGIQLAAFARRILRDAGPTARRLLWRGFRLKLV